MFEGALRFCAFALAFGCMFIAPGMLLFNLFFDRREHEFFEIVPVSMAFSIALAAVAGTVLFVLHANVDGLMRLMAALLALLIILNFMKYRRTGRKRSMKGEIPAGTRPRASAGRRPFLIGVFVVLLCATALMVYRGSLTGWTSDSYDHVGTVREIMENREIMPADAFYGGAEQLRADPRKGLFHTCLAMLCIVTKVEPFQMWLWLPIVLLPILVCGYLAFANRLFKNRDIAFLSAILFLICFGGLDRSALRAVGYPLNVALEMYLVALCFMFAYYETKQARFLCGSALLGCGILLVHMYYFFQFVLALGSLFIFSWLFWRGEGRLTRAVGTLGVLTVVIATPLLALRYKLSYAIANPYDLGPRHLLFITKHVFVTNPVEAWKILGPMGIMAFGATPFLFKRARVDAGILFLFCGMVTTPLIIFNPAAVYVLGRVLTYGLVRRIALFAPYIAVIGFCCYQAVSSLRDTAGARHRFRNLACVLVAAILVIPYARGFVSEFSPAAAAWERAHSPLRWRDALVFMQEHIREPSVILSDPLTSFSIPAFTRHDIVAVLIGHSSPQDAENIDRVIAASDVLNPYVDMQKTVGLLDKYRAQYILLNQSFASPVYETFWAVDPKNYGATRHKFESLPDLFEPVWARDGVLIYRYRSGASALSRTVSPPSLPFVLERLPQPPEKPIAVFLDHFALMEVETDKERVSRGDTLTMRCYWKCSSADNSTHYYKIFVRFDTPYNKSVLYTRAFSKLYRLVLQKMNHTRYRFRSEHNPVNGVYSPRLWRTGDIIEDEFRVVVPRDVSRGRYDIRINLLSVPFSPNYWIKDLVSDNDIYEGAKVGTVIVE
jgi:hypothetical protein